MTSRDPIEHLIDLLSHLPSIGRKSATRLAMHLVQDSGGLAEELASALTEARRSIRHCELCGNFTSGEGLCRICADEHRERRVIAVVERVPDLLAIESSNVYRGLYHVLGGAISPINGVSPDDIRLRELSKRVADGQADEIIIATNPTVEGDATALYIRRMLAESGIRVTRLASGVPMGGNLEYIDGVTISRAMDGRRDL